MIVAIERNLFNYVLKYNCVSISNTQLFDIGIEAIYLLNPTSFIINEFDRILPVFEQDQEILLLEVDKSKLIINSLITLPFSSIISIFPLTIKAKNILSGKLNQSLELKDPIFENIIEEVKFRRAINYRELAFNKLANIYHCTEILEADFTNTVQKNILELIRGENSTNSYLFNLLNYNYTPNEISSGNIEYLEKIGIIAFTYKAKTSEGFVNSPFYVACEKYKKEINEKSYSEGYIKYQELLKKEDMGSPWRQSDEKIKAIVTEKFDNLDMFKISYFYLAIKTKLNKNDGNLIELDEQLIRDLCFDQRSMIHVLYLVCFTFSFEQLYESIHILGKANLFVNKFLERDVQSMQFIIREEQRKLELQSNQLYKNNKIPGCENTEVIDVINSNGKPANIANHEGNFEILESNTNATEFYVKNDFTETVDINYEHNKPKSLDVIDIEKETENEDVKINSSELDEHSSKKELFTVQVFKSNFLKTKKGATKAKWTNLLEYYFPNNNDELTFENLKIKLDMVPDLKINDKDMALIKGFFVAIK
jgi:hypothetical protein